MHYLKWTEERLEMTIHYQDGGVFDGANHGIDDDDDFDYEGLLRHV
jgi:hypothetical protein